MAEDRTIRHIDLTDGSSNGHASASGNGGAAAEVEAGPEVGQLQTAARLVLRPCFRFLWRIRTEGIENIPSSGPVIIAANHTSVMDSFLVPTVLPRRITYVGKAEYLDDWKTRKLFPALGMIPIDRSGGSASERALNTAARALERGEMFAIYPEGTRSRSGKLHKGHTGVARLALRCSAPIVPVGLIGTRDIQPPEAKLPRPFMSATIRFGRPIDVSRYGNRHDDRLVLRQITDELMFEIRELTGQEYDPTYATKPSREVDAPTPTAVGSGARSRPDDDVDPTVSRRSSAEVLAGHPRAG
ncbi:MAG: lysophospholipid acyltransferase family protein [Acidimicrobiales bacterium]